MCINLMFYIAPSLSEEGTGLPASTPPAMQAYEWAGKHWQAGVVLKIYIQPPPTPPYLRRGSIVCLKR